MGGCRKLVDFKLKSGNVDLDQGSGLGGSNHVAGAGVSAFSESRT